MSRCARAPLTVGHPETKAKKILSPAQPPDRPLVAASCFLLKGIQTQPKCESNRTFMIIRFLNGKSAPISCDTKNNLSCTFFRGLVLEWKTLSQFFFPDWDEKKNFFSGETSGTRMRDIFFRAHNSLGATDWSTHSGTEKLLVCAGFSLHSKWK